MKLLYLWIENYKDKISKQEFSFSPEYHIHYDNDLNILSITRNKDYISDFYGENILDVTAIVGENGSGKTTVAKCIYDICKSIVPESNNADTENAKIIIYSKENCDVQDEKLFILYCLKDPFAKEIDMDIEHEIINLYSMSSARLKRAEKEHEISVAYFTNVFDVSHTITNQGMSEYTENQVRKSICCSPMLMIKKEMQYVQKSYGAQSKNNGMVLDVIQQYAQKMGIGVEEAYTAAFDHNFLISVRNTPDAIASILPAFSDFKLSIVQFGEYIAYDTRFEMMNEFDKSIYFIRKNIYEKLICASKNNNWMKIYVNILCEIVMFMNVFNSAVKNVDFDSNKINSFNIDSSEVFEAIINQIADENKKALIQKIKDVNKIDLSILEDFFEINKDESQLKETQWYQQVKAFKTLYEYKYRNLIIPDKINGNDCELIEILLKEYHNPETFWDRMVRIVLNPMSSGEIALINIFSSVYKVMVERTEGNILLIIDEIDAFLHPKWQQNILTYIIKWINEEDVFKKKKVQIILVSHSPIILSDIPNDRVIYLRPLCHVENQMNLTFGANISQLFYDSFFMENGSIGAFSRSKIQKVIDYLENKKTDINDMEIEYIIKNIGEPFVRRKLQQDLKHKRFLGEYNDKN